MAELVNAYIDWQVCEISISSQEVQGSLDEMYPIPPLPRVSLTCLLLVLGRGAELTASN